MKEFDLFAEVAAVLDEAVEVDGHDLHGAGHDAAGAEREREVVVFIQRAAQAAAGGEAVHGVAGVDEE